MAWPQQCGHCGRSTWTPVTTNTNSSRCSSSSMFCSTAAYKSFTLLFGFLAIPQDQAAKLYTQGLQMAQLHGQLMDFYAGEERELFNMTSKTHFCLHSLFLARYIHPCLVWCFKGEETMQRVQKLWKSCLAGSKHWQVSKKAALKERHLLFLRHKVG